MSTRSVPTTTIRDHLAPFIDAGWPRTIIAAAAGVSRATVGQALDGTHTTVKSGTAQALLRLTFADLERHRHTGRAPVTPRPSYIDATGTRRRIQALYRMGWDGATIARHMGLRTADSVNLYTQQARVHVSTARKVAAAYDELCMTHGPSVITRKRAERQGWPLPLMWDDDTIDDPTATPHTGHEDRRDGVHADDIAWVCRHERHTWATLSARFGINPASLKTVLRRAGMHDLQARITTWSEEAAA